MGKDLNLSLETVSALLGQHMKIHNGYSRDTVSYSILIPKGKAQKNNILQISK
jgi:hypothetical protein